MSTEFANHVSVALTVRLIERGVVTKEVMDSAVEMQKGRSDKKRIIDVLIEGNNGVASISGSIDSLAAVPEPAQIGSVVVGALVAIAVWRRAKQNRS